MNRDAAEELGSRVLQERKVTKDPLVQLALLGREGSLESMARRDHKDQVALKVKMEIKGAQVVLVVLVKLGIL